MARKVIDDAVVIGVDASLTSTGFAYRAVDGYHTGRIKPNQLRGPVRLDYIEKSITDVMSSVYVANHRIDALVLEGYAMGGRQGRGRLFDIGELGGVLKLLAFRQGIDVLLVPPSNLKQFATGSGKAQKPEVVQAIAERWGYNVPQDDEADAFVLMKMGEVFLRSRRPRVEHMAAALRKCQLVPGRK